MKRRLLLPFLLGCASVQAATVQCTADGTVSPPVLVNTKSSDCTVIGANGYYTVTFKREPKHLQATCWRDGPGGDAAMCAVAVVRESTNRRVFYIGTFRDPGTSGRQAAWFSLQSVN